MNINPENSPSENPCRVLVVEDEAGAQHRDRAPGSGGLLGLYEGIPLGKRGQNYSGKETTSCLNTGWIPTLS